MTVRMRAPVGRADLAADPALGRRARAGVTPSGGAAGRPDEGTRA